MTSLPYRWELLVWLWLAFLFNQADRQVFNVVLPAIRAGLGLTAVQAGLVGSVFTIALAIVIPVAGYVGDIWSRKRIVVFSLFGWSVSTLLTGFSPGLLYLIIVRSVATGVGEGFYAPSAFAMIGEHHVETRAQAMALHQTSLYLGVVLSGLVAGWLGDHFGWRSAFWAALLAAACVWPYRSAWPKILDVLAYYDARWQNYHASLYAVFAWFSGSHDFAAGLGIGVVVGMALWLAARRADPVRAAYLLVGAILMLAPNGYSWYFTWIVPLLCFYPNPAWLLLTVLQFLSYNVLIGFQATGRWHFDPFFQWLTYGPFYALLLGQAVWEKLKHSATRA